MEYFYANLWQALCALGCSAAYLLYSGLKYRQAHVAAAGQSVPTPSHTHPARSAPHRTWVIYASQTGQAEAIAQQTAQRLESAGLAVHLCRIDQAWLPELAAGDRALFVVSTFGEGSAPDHAGRFLPQLLGTKPALRGLRYGLLALGDRSYASFCAFGRRLDQWLHEAGAQAVFPRIELDRLDPQGLAAWQSGLSAFDAPPALAAPAAQPTFTNWRFVSRCRLNTGSPGPAMCLVTLAPPDGLVGEWQAGDLVELLPPGAQGQARCYSIANLPGSGRLELIVRTARRADGQPGLASGWLNSQALADEPVRLRIRRNAGFHPQHGADTPVILIGAGSGLAGLRAHLQHKVRALAGQRPPARCAWLLYGERNETFDRPCGEELARLHADGILSRMDLRFSHRTPEAPHVQHALMEQAVELRHWIDAGAHILICGGAQTMARGVDHALRAILGDLRVDGLIESRRLLRDIY